MPKTVEHLYYCILPECHDTPPRLHSRINLFLIWHRHSRFIFAGVLEQRGMQLRFWEWLGKNQLDFLSGLDRNRDLVLELVGPINRVFCNLREASVWTLSDGMDVIMLGKSSRTPHGSVFY